MDFVDPSGRRVRRSADTCNRAQAQELHDQRKSEAWRVHRLGDRPKRTWQDAAERWVREQAHKATYEEDKSKLRWLHPYLAHRKLEDIDRALIDTITGARQAERCANAMINRTLALVRAILRRCARDWEWLDRAPTVRLLREPTRRIRFLTREQAQRLLRELPPHLEAMATFTLATGLRASNVTGLSWEQVDLERRIAWIHPDQAKARRAIAVPLNGTAMRVVRAQYARHPVFLFTFKGSPVRQVSTKAWYNALARAEIKNFRWHDLRHTWASWHVQSGTPLFALQELAGWETEKMARRYAHFAADHLAAYADKLEIAGTNAARQADFCGTPIPTC
jgi:integrase